VLAGRDEDRLVAGAADLEEDLALVLELYLSPPFPTGATALRGTRHGATSPRRPCLRARVCVARRQPHGVSRSYMAATVRLHRWDEIALEKVTEMVSRKIVTGEREMLAQIYLKRGALVPVHSHESEQMTYVLSGALKFLIDGEEITVREGEVLHVPSWVPHQAEALEDTFELDLFSPIRTDWLDGTDDYFRK
jgi:quercetin dioxygenase-like cupin family protein